MDTYGHTHGHIWTHMDTYGHICVHMNTYGYITTNTYTLFCVFTTGNDHTNTSKQRTKKNKKETAERNYEIHMKFTVKPAGHDPQAQSQFPTPISATRR